MNALATPERSPNEAIGDSLRQARLRRSLTQEQLAGLVQVSISTIVRWENGHSRPRAGHRIALAGALALSSEQLSTILDGSPAQVIPLHPNWIQPGESADPGPSSPHWTERQQRILEAIALGIERGDAQAAGWRRLIRALARAEGIEWSESRNPAIGPLEQPKP